MRRRWVRYRNARQRKGQPHAQQVEQQGRDVCQRVLHQDKGRSPQRNHRHQKYVRAQGLWVPCRRVPVVQGHYGKGFAVATDDAWYTVLPATTVRSTCVLRISGGAIANKSLSRTTKSAT